MRAVFGLVLIVGVALAGGAVMMAKNYIAEYQGELARERAARNEIVVVPTTEVFVAKRALRYGETLSADSVETVLWPQDGIPEGSFTELTDLFPADSDEPRYVLRAMEPGEAIMAVKVTKPGQEAGLISRLERGKRAFTIKVDVASGVSGFLRPGDRVDVYWSGQLAKGQDITRLIQAGINLIAVDQKAGADHEGAMIARTVTVSVRPEQVAALAQAQNTGRLSLSLVGADDDTVASAIEVDQRALLGLGAIETAPEVVEEKVCTIRTRRGAEVVEIPIPCTN